MDGASRRSDISQGRGHSKPCWTLAGLEVSSLWWKAACARRDVCRSPRDRHRISSGMQGLVSVLSMPSTTANVQFLKRGKGRGHGSPDDRVHPHHRCRPHLRPSRGPCERMTAPSPVPRTIGSFVARSAWQGSTVRPPGSALLCMASARKESCARQSLRPENGNLRPISAHDRERVVVRRNLRLVPNHDDIAGVLAPEPSAEQYSGRRAVRTPYGAQGRLLASTRVSLVSGVPCLAAGISPGGWTGSREDVMVAPARGLIATLRLLHGGVSGTGAGPGVMTAATWIPLSLLICRTASVACRCRGPTADGAMFPSSPTGCRFIAAISWKYRATAACGPRRTRFWAGRMPSDVRWGCSSSPTSNRSSHHHQASRSATPVISSISFPSVSGNRERKAP